VFLTWLRLAYGSFREKLDDAIDAVKIAYLAKDKMRAGDPDVDISRLRSKYIYLLNLRFLFRFVIPTVQDYGLAIKLFDVKRFKTCLHRLLKFFFCVRGSNPYSRAFYLFLQHWYYWEANNVLIIAYVNCSLDAYY